MGIRPGYSYVGSYGRARDASNHGKPHIYYLVDEDEESYKASARDLVRQGFTIFATSQVPNHQIQRYTGKYHTVPKEVPEEESVP